MLDPNRGYPFATDNGRLPAAEGKQFPNPLAMYYPVNFAAASEVLLDFLDAELMAQIDLVQTIFIDNADNPNAFILTIGISNQRLICPPNSQGYFPILVPRHATFVAESTVGAVTVYLQFINVPMAMNCWGVTAPGGGGGGSVSPAPNQGTYTDRSGTITLGGTSQTLMAANASRKRYVIENPSDAPSGESLFVNFTGAADSPTALTSFEILPGGYIDSGAGPVSTQAITVNAASTGHVFIAKEM